MKSRSTSFIYGIDIYTIHLFENKYAHNAVILLRGAVMDAQLPISQLFGICMKFFHQNFNNLNVSCCGG
ncbi:MAG: hypothetical protein FJX80_13510 [Bacteroidetes bacterium]|nr:hypothetical protein [Bacteroidota bacterium]